VAGFENATYIVTVGNGTAQTLNVYMVPDTGDTVIFAFKDQDNENTVIENVLFTMQLKVNGTYYTVQSRYSDITGRVELPYVDSSTYRFTTLKDGYVDKEFILSPIIFASYTVRLTRTLVTNNTALFNGLGIEIDPQIYQNNATNNFTITLTSPEGLLELFTYNLSTSTNNTIIQNQSANAYGATLGSQIYITNADYNDRVYLNVSYYTTTGASAILQYSYEIASNTTGTFTDTGSDSVPLFDKIVLIVVAAVIFVSLGMIYGGPTGAGIVAIFIFVMMGATNVIPMWAVILTFLLALVGIIFNAARGSF
jgi:hypothetical protein